MSANGTADAGAPQRANGHRASSAATAGGPLRLSVLGATGSVGTSTLDLVAEEPGAFQVVALTAQSNAEKLAGLARAHRAGLAVIGDETRLPELRERLAGSGVRAAAGTSGLMEAASQPADCVMAAIVGAAGLRPTLAAARASRRILLANKECLVTAGALFTAGVADAGAELLPVDSEHSAVLQALHGARVEAIEKIAITASGGPFRGLDRAALAQVTPEQALCHPNWSMGPKITIDSATLMNKGLELIEAFHLFPVGEPQLEVVVHPQSIVHCLVYYLDGSVIAQLAAPDMRTPIAVSLAWPDRMAASTPRLDLVRMGQLTFEAPDTANFPALGLARQALRRGGSAPAVLNAANEVAVEAFLDRRIGFLEIAGTVERCLETAEAAGLICEPGSIDEALEADADARRLARNVIATT